MAETPEFFNQAECKNTTVDMHPERTDRAGIILAKSICATCVVKTECLDFAIATKEPDGVWGEKMPSERRTIARKRRNNHDGTGRYGNRATA